MRKYRQLLSTFLLTATVLTVCAVAQTNLTQIRDTINNSDGTPFNGTVVITWNGGSTTLSGTVSPLSTSARIYNGALSVLLVPTTTAASGSFYQVVYSSSDGTTQWTETWVVPPSSNALSVAAVRTSTTSGSGSSTGSSGSTGTGTGGTQYATLPIAMTQVTGLSASLSSLSTSITGLQTSVTSLTSTVNTLSTNASAPIAQTQVTGLSTALSSINTSVTGLQTTVTSLSNTVAGLSSGSGLNVVFVDAETPAGAINGTNTAFTLAGTPSPVASLDLYRNGLLQKAGLDYTLNGSAISFLSIAIPRTGDVLQAYYRVAGSTSPVPNFTDGETPGGATNGTNTTFTLVTAPSPAMSLMLYRNGILMHQGGDYSLTGSTITFAAAATPQSGDLLSASYRH